MQPGKQRKEAGIGLLGSRCCMEPQVVEKASQWWITEVIPIPAAPAKFFGSLPANFLPPLTFPLTVGQGFDRAVASPVTSCDPRLPVGSGFCRPRSSSASQTSELTQFAATLEVLKWDDWNQPSHQVLVRQQKPPVGASRQGMLAGI